MSNDDVRTVNVAWLGEDPACLGEADVRDLTLP